MGSKCAAENRLIQVYFTIPDLEIVTTVRIGADPGFVVNRCPLTAEIRQGHQYTGVTFLTFRKRAIFQWIPPPVQKDCLKHILKKARLQIKLK